MKKLQCYIPIILTLLFLISGGIIGLSLTLYYAYLPNLSSYQNGMCTLNKCQLITFECCKRCDYKSTKICCSTCSSVNVNFTLMLNDTLYNKIINYNKFNCNVVSETCYYIDGDIYNSLSLQPLLVPNSTTGVVFLSLFLFVSLISLIFIVTYMFINYKTNNESTVDNL